MSSVVQENIIQIGGAEPAGLAAAITLAKAGRRVLVHEAQGEVGYRFDGDFQGLENWSTQQDVLGQRKELGITTQFAKLPCDHGYAFDAWGERYDLAASKTLFYMVERGPGPESLDTALLEQACGLGVEVRFNSRLDHLEGAGILAVGPKAVDAIAVGYHFETAMQDGFWAIFDDKLAPQGYAYLLVMNGRGTVKSCMFAGYKQERLYVERTVAAFQRMVGLEMVNPRSHGGAGNFRIPAHAVTGVHPVAGEEAGFQDFLFGFGMLGNRGYRWVLRRNQTKRWDARRVLCWVYQPGPFKHLLLPWVRRRYHSQRQDESCNHINCTCVWCRHGCHQFAGTEKACAS